MKNAKPKHPWFRFHLLTAVLMMVAAGLAVGFNLRCRDGLVERVYHVRPHEPIEMRVYGWPVTALETFGDPDRYWSLSGIIVDALVAAVLVAATALVSDLIIRRREARKPPAPP